MLKSCNSNLRYFPQNLMMKFGSYSSRMTHFSILNCKYRIYFVCQLIKEVLHFLILYPWDKLHSSIGMCGMYNWIIATSIHTCRDNPFMKFDTVTQVGWQCNIPTKIFANTCMWRNTKNVLLKIWIFMIENDKSDNRMANCS